MHKHFPIWKIRNKRFPHFNHPISAVDTAISHPNWNFLSIIMSDVRKFNPFKALSLLSF
ncbi:hypothetical protein EMIT079MI2_20441 [Bacillus sp. IT-79MI2]